MVRGDTNNIADAAAAADDDNDHPRQPLQPRQNDIGSQVGWIGRQRRSRRRRRDGRTLVPTTTLASDDVDDDGQYEDEVQDDEDEVQVAAAAAAADDDDDDHAADSYHEDNIKFLDDYDKNDGDDDGGNDGTVEISSGSYSSSSSSRRIRHRHSHRHPPPAAHRQSQTSTTTTTSTTKHHYSLPPSPTATDMATDDDDTIIIPRVIYMLAGCAAWNSAILGYDPGVSSLSVLLVQKTLNLTDVQISAYLGILNLCAMVGSLLASVINERYGRRGCFVVTSIGFILGDLIQASAQSFHTLIIGRSLLGLSIGQGLAIDPMYISEISPPSRRGFLVSWSEIAINLGWIFGFASGIIFYNVPDNLAWRYMYTCGAILPITMLVLVKWYMPESPRWLLSKGYDEEARRVLKRLYFDDSTNQQSHDHHDDDDDDDHDNGVVVGMSHQQPATAHHDITTEDDDGDDDDVDTMMNEIKTALRQEQANAGTELGWTFLLCRPTPAYRRMLLAGFIAGISQQVVGIEGINSFETFVLDQSGVHDRYWQAMTLVGIQIIKSFVTIGSSRLVDTWGRRVLSFISIGGIVISLLVLALDFHLSSGATSNLAVVGLLGYMVSFAAGMGPVAWLIPSEVFTTSLRSKGMAITIFANRAVSTMMSSTFLELEKIISWSGVFLVLAGLSTTMAGLIYWYVPETKGRSLEDMTVFFATITGDRSVLDHLNDEENENIITNSGTSCGLLNGNGNGGGSGILKIDSGSGKHDGGSTKEPEVMIELGALT